MMTTAYQEFSCLWDLPMACHSGTYVCEWILFIQFNFSFPKQ